MVFLKYAVKVMVLLFKFMDVPKQQALEV